jgi:hypothetical protein
VVGGAALYGFTLLLPTALIGVLVDRWWALSLALSLFALPARAGTPISHCSSSLVFAAHAPEVAFGALAAGTVLAVARREFTKRRSRPSR